MKKFKPPQICFFISIILYILFIYVVWNNLGILLIILFGTLFGISTYRCGKEETHDLYSWRDEVRKKIGFKYKKQ